MTIVENAYVFSSDGFHHFKDINNWICTDPDCGQFCYKHDDHTFTYLQVTTESKFKDESRETGEEFLKNHKDDLTAYDIYIDDIDVSLYTDEEIDEYVKPYGEILDGSEGVWRNQLIAECIFETDWLGT